MKFCGECKEDKIAACDYCRMYNFNGDKEGKYVDRGFCVLHDEDRHPGSICEDFICFKYDKNNR